MGVKLGQNIPHEGLVFSVDPASSMSWDGTNYKNLSHSNHSTTRTGTINHTTDGGGAFTFNANGSYFNFGDESSSPLWKLYNLSLVGWVKQGSTGSPHQTVICTSETYQYGIKLMSRYHTQGVSVWVGNGDGASHILNTGIDITGDNQYHLIACTRNGGSGEVKIYVDGVLGNTKSFGIDQQAFKGGMKDTGSTLLGADYHSTGYHHTGNIGQVYGYNTTLSEEDILQIYNSGKERYGL